MKKYGLQIRAPSQKKQPILRRPASIFGEDEDEEDVEKEISRQASKAKSLKETEEQRKKDLEEDPSAYAYDEVYDDMKHKAVVPKLQDRQDRKMSQPRYVHHLMKKAEQRQKEQEIVYERKLAKEREKDEHLFSGKEKFITGAYKRKLEEQKKWLAEERLRGNGNNYETFDFNKIFVDEGDEERGAEDRSKPYSLGPKISDWDEQRRDWLKQNPSFPNFVAPNKPRVLLVTGSAPKPCENPVGDHYLLKSIKNKIDYCRIHGIEIFYNMALLDAEMAGFWAKLPLIRKLLLSHPEIEFLWWMDSDAMFTDMVFELPWERYKDYNLVMHGWNEMVYDQKNWIGLNTGSFLLRNSQWALDLLDAWAPMGPKGKIREEAGKILTRELKDRPAFEADDQSAMVYLLATEREKWGGKVYLESGYYLHGYWGILVDRYEEMIENHKPGFGDHRWPLVTHFVGCKPCGKFGDYPVERCLRQMDRAFNFGDNQILQMYGFTHKSLGSRRVKPTRNQTDRPLDAKDEFGLLHPSFKAAKLTT